ncbi:MAG: glycosyltransferase family 2 protein [Betaproteobacteria bacterium]|nr:glycosyltransferase family 2 protein [Candidatus Dechloromonas phosphorivorans]
MNEPNRPLVTFALFAYNQEKYIREAVVGALQQDYSPIEIIISDDCSTDKTFEIIQELSEEYEGCAKIILNRNKKNVGLIGHINKVMDIASGELVIVAAKDDISLSDRVSKNVKFYLDMGKPDSILVTILILTKPDVL